MKDYIIKDPWRVIEDSFHPEFNLISESIFSIGNGHIGQRANFEEGYSGKTLQGSYVAGVYYPDKTRVGWWKNGYPEYFAKVLNSANWIGLDIELDGKVIDLNHIEIKSFKRILDMRNGTLSRHVIFEDENGGEYEICSERFCHFSRKELGLLKYQIKQLRGSSAIKISSKLDFDVKNQDSNYDEKFWNEVKKDVNEECMVITAATKKTDFHVSVGLATKFILNQGRNIGSKTLDIRDKYGAVQVETKLREGETVEIIKYAAILSSLDHSKNDLHKNCHSYLENSISQDYKSLKREHQIGWHQKWDECDVTIEGDISAQQGIRFNIFQLYQTYTGDDARLNIGPKGFTGEKYGGSTYWDTEAYCIPFYLSTAKEQVAKNLLIYRYNHLAKAIENAEKLGFTDGAALYPMVTMNGEECHNEWEITFEEIHRNGAIAYAIFDYVRYTGDSKYILDYGLEVLIAISRFWAQRVNFSKAKNKYVILGVTGPNEYENNVNNNWYTNYIAKWCLNYTHGLILEYSDGHPIEMDRILEKCKFNRTLELDLWKKIETNIYLPEDLNNGIYLQQDGFLDKDLRPAASIPKDQCPINQNWSWDRILRSPFIKQADVLQGIYFFEDHFEQEIIKRNYSFYEPLTVHESSLSPCIHSILATSLKMYDKAYEMYLRTSRLDLDDYNNDTEDGLHITSMAGSWMSIVKGFAGMRVIENILVFKPYLPVEWVQYSFKIKFRGRLLNVIIDSDGLKLILLSGKPMVVKVYDSEIQLEHVSKLKLQLEIKNT